jgi:hypothetical protein
LSLISSWFSNPYKRHEQYIEQKKVTENNKETGIKETNTNNIEDSSSEDDSDSTDSEMDTVMSMKILYIVLQQCSLSIIVSWGDDPLYKQ